MKKNHLWRITARFDTPGLRAKAEKLAKKRRWSLNDVIHEAVIEFVERH